jgi:cytoskeleton-associated protein 5
LNESFAGEEKPTQTRLTRAQQRERALKEAEASLEGTIKENGEGGEARAGDVPDEEAEPMDFSDPVSILDKLPPDFYDMLASTKWKERKELALEPLLEILKKSPKIVDANYDELVRALAGRMSDANIVCVIAAANCIECIAKALKTAFSRYKPMTVPPILERCKEKKQSVTDALAAALDAAAASVSVHTRVPVAIAKLQISRYPFPTLLKM